MLSTQGENRREIKRKRDIKRKREIKRERDEDREDALLLPPIYI